MTLGKDGMFYSLANWGGSCVGTSGTGFVYQLDPTTRIMTSLHQFCFDDSPRGAPVMAADGALYGAVYRYNGGYLYRLVPPAR
jgi:hypothetical protein